jgi:tol-pal system protein YbgF
VTGIAAHAAAALSLAIVPLSLVSAAGCASRDVSGLRTQVTDLRVAQDLVAADLARVLAELRSLEARVGETQDTTRESATELARLRARVQAAEDALRQPRPVVAPAPAVSPAPVGAIRPLTARLTPAPVEATPREAAGDEPVEQAFAAALNTFRAREHGQAVLDFMDFITRYPTHPLATTAQFWIGEAYFVQRDYAQAIVEYEHVLAMTPRAAIAPDALLRIGMSHAALRDATPATEAWQRVLREYPSSDAAGKARTLLGARLSRQP